MSIQTVENDNKKEQCTIQNVSCSSSQIDEKCKRVLKYLFPYYETDFTITKYENAMEALRSIAK